MYGLKYLVESRSKNFVAIRNLKAWEILTQGGQLRADHISFTSGDLPLASSNFAKCRVQTLRTVKKSSSDTFQGECLSYLFASSWSSESIPCPRADDRLFQCINSVASVDPNSVEDLRAIDLNGNRTPIQTYSLPRRLSRCTFLLAIKQSLTRLGHSPRTSASSSKTLSSL